MTQLITNTISRRERDNHLWMVIAFMAGIVFTAALAQFIAGTNYGFPGLKANSIAPVHYDFPTPSFQPDNDSMVSPEHGLVYACPEGKGRLA
jgi:hypothetical protein